VAVSILLIDDDLATIHDLQPGLAREGFQVDHTLPGRSAIRQALVDEPDLVILGIGAQDTTWQFCRRLMTFLDQPVLLLLDTGRRLDRVRGLDMGADDCMFKPVLQIELAARVRALLRRDLAPSGRREQSFFADGDLVVDLSRHEVRRDDVPVALTPTEYRILACFVRHAGEMLPHDRLLQEVWGPAHVHRHSALKQYIHHLRRKLEPDPSRPQRIVTHWGQGYAFQRLTGG